MASSSSSASRGQKRKFTEHVDSHAEDSPHRPSPHQPSNLATSQSSHPPSSNNNNNVASPTQRARGSSRRGARGNRGRRSTSSPTTRSNPPDTSTDNNMSATSHQPPQSHEFAFQHDTPLPTASSEAATSAEQPGVSNTSPTLTKQEDPSPSNEPAELPEEDQFLVSYEHLTDELLQEWSAGGREKAIEQASAFVDENNHASLSRIFHELIYAATSGRMTPEDAASAVKAICEKPPKDGACTSSELFLDSLSICEAWGLDTKDPLLKRLIFSAELPPDELRTVLDQETLMDLQLVRPSFPKQSIKKRTNLLYKQSNYNLLREESEGYAKLMTELYNAGQDEAPTTSHVRNTLLRVKALIGTFDLDVGRVLDIMLDVGASILIRNYRFVVKLLRESTYWPEAPDIAGLSVQEPIVPPLPYWAHPNHEQPFLDMSEILDLAKAKDRRDRYLWEAAEEYGLSAFFMIGRPAVMLDPDAKTREIEAASNSSDANSSDVIEWIKRTGTLPPGGNKDAAQLLGHKLRYYTSKVRSKQDVEPASLNYLAALLIKIGFISLVDLYPHLHPNDDDMELLKQKGMKEREERERTKRPGSIEGNALARAPVLPVNTKDERRYRSATERAAALAKAQSQKPIKKSNLPEPTDQKVTLLKNLLLIGALPESLFLLGRHPWLLDTVPELPKYFFRILHHCLSKLYDNLPTAHSSTEHSSTAQVPSHDQGTTAKDSLTMSQHPAPRTIKWAQIDTKDQDGNGTEYKFYWEEWVDTIPMCEKSEDIYTLCDTLLAVVGVKIGQDAELLLKLVRLGKRSIDMSPGKETLQRWYNLLKRYLCPALSLTNHNKLVIDEVYSLVQSYDAKHRYSIYQEWFESPLSAAQLDLKDAFALARHQTRDILKSITKLNPPKKCRELGKASTSSPGIVIGALINQLETYDNLTDLTLDSGKYFTDLAFDVLSWQILTFLGREGRSRVSQTGFNASRWLVHLATFAGKWYKKYPALNLKPMMQFIYRGGLKDNYTDLRVLRIIVQIMSGMAPLVEVTDAQIIATGGGPRLKELMLDRSPSNPDALKRLLDALKEGQIGYQLLILVGQACRKSLMADYHDTKLLVEIYDELTTVFNHLLDLLQTHTPIQEFAKSLPSMCGIVNTYGMDIVTAFTLHRKGIAESIFQYHEKRPESDKTMTTTSTLEGLMTTTAIQNAQPPNRPIRLVGHKGLDAMFGTLTAKTRDSPNENARTLQASSSDKATTETQPKATQAKANTTVPCHPVLQDLLETIRPILPKNMEASLNPAFYITFWQLSLADLVEPINMYNEGTKRLSMEKASVNSDRSDPSLSGARRREERKRAVREKEEELKLEMKTQTKRYGPVQALLLKHKEQWFKDPQGGWETLNKALWQYCFRPRIILSPMDAVYTSRLIFWLHSMDAKNFRTMQVLEFLFTPRFLINFVYHCTTRQSESFGRFLAEVLKTLHEWHGSRQVYERCAWGPAKHLAGFATKINDDGKIESFLDYEDFRTLLYKWHGALHECLKTCMDRWEYMHVKNAINVYKWIYPIFPVINDMGVQLLDQIQDIIKQEDPSGKSGGSKVLARGDIGTSANSLYPLVKKREKTWVPRQKFCIVPGEAAVPPSAIDTQPSSQVGTEESKTVFASAPEPAPRAVSTSAAPPMSAVSVEDGELKDTPSTARAASSLPAAVSNPASDPSSGGAEKTEKSKDTDQGSGASDQPQSRYKVTPTKRRRSSEENLTEEERSLKRRAMEAIKRKNEGESRSFTKSSDVREETRNRSAPSSKPLTPQSSRPPSRNPAGEYAPDRPRRDRERPPRSSDYDSRDMHRSSHSIPSTSLRHSTERPVPRYPHDSGRTSRYSDTDYGRLNAEADVMHDHHGHLPRGGSHAPQPPYPDRKQVDAPGRMGPPPARDHGPPSSRSAYGSTRVSEPHSSGPSASSAERHQGMNPERAARLGKRSDHPTDGRSYAKDPHYPSDPSTYHENEPSSPKRARYSDNASSIRNRTGAAGPDPGSSPQTHGPPPSSSTKDARSALHASGVHKSRLGQIESVSRPPPLQTSPHEMQRRSRPPSAYAPSPTSAPSGPRSAGPGSSSVPSPTTYGPPIGPSGSHVPRAQPPPATTGPIQHDRIRDNGRDRHRERSPDRSGHRETRERNYSKEYRGERADYRADDRERNDRMNYRSSERLERNMRDRPEERSLRDRSERTERPDPTSRDRYERMDRSERPDLMSRDRSERIDRSERSDPMSRDRGEHVDRHERPDLMLRDRNERVDRSERPDLRQRSGRSDLMSREPREPRHPRELMPEGPSGGRGGRDSRLRSYDRERERSPVREGRRNMRELREPRETRDYGRGGRGVRR